MKCYLVSSCETEDDQNRIIIGRRSSPLTARGIKQSESIAIKVQSLGIRPALIYASTQFQALETGKIIAKKLSLSDPMQKMALRERSLGIVEGKPTLPNWQEPFTSLAMPESTEALNQRVKTLLAHLRQDHEHQTIMIITHPVLCAVFISTVDSMSLERVLKQTRPKDGSLYLLSTHSDEFYQELSY